MPNDPFSALNDNVIGPARAPFSVTPSDTVALVTVPKALYVGTGGAITLRGVDSTQDVVLRNVASGQVLDIRALYVRATGTTASDIVGLA